MSTSYEMKDRRILSSTLVSFMSTSHILYTFINSTFVLALSGTLLFVYCAQSADMQCKMTFSIKHIPI